MHTQTKEMETERVCVCEREEWGERDDKLSEAEGQRKRDT